MTEYVPELFEAALSKHKTKWRKIQDKEVSYSFPVPDITLKEVFNELADRHPDKTFIYYRNRAYTYGECNLWARKIANGLRRIGCKKGDRVNTYIKNSPEFVCITLACFKLGLILVNSNPLDVANEIENKIQDCAAKVVIADENGYLALCKALRKMKRGPKYLILIGKETSVIHDISQRVETLESISVYGNEEPAAEINPNDIAVLQYTGGTTGVIKGCCQTNRAYIARAMAAEEYFKPVFSDEDVENFSVIIGLPFSHAYGFAQGIIVNMAFGGNMILTDTIKPQLKEILEKIQLYKAKLWPAIPLWMKLLTSDEDMQSYDLSSLKAISCGAASLPLAVLNKVEAVTGLVINEGYGMTETVNTITHNSFGFRKPGTVGVPYPNIDYLIVDQEDGDKIVADGVPGEIIARGVCVIKEYWQRPEETEYALRNGWLYTGDIGMIDEEGYLVILDRKKDLIIVSGFNVFPREIDDVVITHPAVADSCTVGVADPRKGEVPKTYVVLKHGCHNISEDEIIKYCNERLTRYKVPKSVEFIDIIPKTKNNKPDRNALKMMYSA
jgi:Acyl-CoA synthetases (AMP-forming)/AMP-acid ligases II